MPIVVPRRLCCVFSMFVCCLPAGLLGLGTAQRAAAEEPSGLQVAVALENVLTNAIAQTEKSVVAIARVKIGSQLERHDGLNMQSRALPGDVGFIPNDFGTGVVLERSGLILTHYHVVAENSNYYVTTSDRKTYEAHVKGADPRSELAVLQISPKELTGANSKELRPINFGDASKLKKGQIVIALGNPYAIARDGQASASWGIIANLSRKAGPIPDETSALGVRNTSLHHYGTLIQTDAKLNLGTSGGALINLKGEMIGLTTSLAAAVGYEQAAGYAIPVDETFRRAVDALKKGQEVEYGYLGVAPSDLSREEIISGKRGVRIGDDVIKNTAAEGANLAKYDVITHVNGQPLYDADGLVLQVGKLPAGADVRLTIQHNGDTRSENVMLTKYPVHGKKVVTTPAPAWRGLRVDYNTANPEIRMPQSKGVIITEVESGSPAYAAGLRPDLFITHVGATPVGTPKEFQAAVASKKGAVQIRLDVPKSDNPVRTIEPPKPSEP